MSCYDFGRANSSQKLAIETTEGPVLIIAGPGTGKTFTLVKRIAYLVMEKGVRPDEIMVVTFTQKAARELLTRISDEFLQYDRKLNLHEMYVGTFHAVCLRPLKENAEYTQQDRKLRVLDAFEQTYLVCRNLEYFNTLGGYNDLISVKGRWKQAQEICRYVSQLQEELVDLDAMESDRDDQMRLLARLVRRYRELMARNSAMDYTAIQTDAYEMLIRHPEVLHKLQNALRYIMVDEYQDTNYIQEQLVLLLSGDRNNICVVGDDDQGMYRFRGATIRNILEFPDRFKENACKVIRLEDNYRSEPGIIDFYNKWMDSTSTQNLFRWDRYRYGKKIRTGKGPILSCPSVYACRNLPRESMQEGLRQMVLDLKDHGNITDYSQVVFLFRSVKSNEAKELAAVFEDGGIPVYSPRSELFFSRQETKQILGCMIMCFLSYTKDLKTNSFLHFISDDMRKYYISCVKEAQKCRNRSQDLLEFISRASIRIRNLQGDSGIGLSDLFYQLLAFEPFNTYAKQDPKTNVTENRACRNLSEISRMISRFAFLHDMHSITRENRIVFPEEFFNIYLRYMCEDGIGEYEDESEYAPAGCVSFMTIHQSKGLEFPVVVVGSLGGSPRKKSDAALYTAECRFFRRKPFEPLEEIRYFDFWRLYYTAFSRAQNLLVLAEPSHGKGNYFSEIVRGLPDIRTLNCEVPFSDIKKINYKHVYSFTSHVAVYEDCPQQYKYYKEYGFAKNRMFHTSVGSLVHATLEDMNRCIIAGRLDQVSEEAIEEWFVLNYRIMQEETGYYLTEEQQEQALKQVIRYYQRRQNELGRVWKAEEEIELVLPDYILQGVIDLIEGVGDTVEIVDYKTGPKPDLARWPDSIDHYKKQLEVYAYLVEKRYGRKVSRMHLYYTSETEGDPIITFPWKKEAVDRTVAELADVVHKIENKEFEGSAARSYACTYCDMRFLCGKALPE